MPNILSRSIAPLSLASLFALGCATDPAKKLDNRVSEREEKLDEYQRKQAELTAEQRQEEAKLEREQSVEQAELRSEYAETLAKKDQRVVEAGAALKEDYEKTMARVQERIDSLDARIDEIDRKANLAPQDERARVLPKLSEARRLHHDLVESKRSASTVTVPVWDDYKARVDQQIERTDQAVASAASAL